MLPSRGPKLGESAAGEIKQQFFKFFRMGRPILEKKPKMQIRGPLPRWHRCDILLLRCILGFCACLLRLFGAGVHVYLMLIIFFVHFSVLLLLFLRCFEVVIFVVVVFGLLLCCYCVLLMSCFESLVVGGYQLECAHFF